MNTSGSLFNVWSLLHFLFFYSYENLSRKLIYRNHTDTVPKPHRTKIRNSEPYRTTLIWCFVYTIDRPNTKIQNRNFKNIEPKYQTSTPARRSWAKLANLNLIKLVSRPRPTYPAKFQVWGLGRAWPAQPILTSPTRLPKFSLHQCIRPLNSHSKVRKPNNL